MAPTRIGISGGKISGDEKERESNLYMYGRCSSRLCSVSSTCRDIFVNREVEWRASTIFISTESGPKGVAY